MKRTLISADWQRELTELTHAALQRVPNYGFGMNGEAIFYAYCREMASLARVDGEYEVADELEALPHRHRKLFHREVE